MSEQRAGEANFESELERLKEVVGKLETGELPLEESVSLFREGMGLAKSCRERLAEARHEIETLSREDVADMAGPDPKPLGDDEPEQQSLLGREMKE